MNFATNQDYLVARFRIFMATGFSFIFFALSLSFALIAVHALVMAVFSPAPLIDGLARTINMAVISLAAFELGRGLHKEYVRPTSTTERFVVLRRTVSRFVIIVFIALAIEGLLMAINYRQPDLASTLFYPVAIVTGTLLLLITLGVFLYFTRAISSPTDVTSREDAKPKPTADAETIRRAYYPGYGR